VKLLRLERVVTRTEITDLNRPSQVSGVVRALDVYGAAWFGFCPKASPSRVCPSMSLAS